MHVCLWQNACFDKYITSHSWKRSLIVLFTFSSVNLVLMDQYKKDSPHNRGISWLKNVSHRSCSSRDVKFLLNYVSFDNTLGTRNRSNRNLEVWKEKGKKSRLFVGYKKWCFFRRRENGRSLRKTTRSKGGNQQQLIYGIAFETQTRANFWRVESALTITMYSGAFLWLKTLDLRQSSSDITDTSSSTAVWGRNVFLTLTLSQQTLSRTVYSLYGVTWIFTSCIASHQMKNGACLLVQRWPEVVWEDYKVFAFKFGFLSSYLLT